MAKLITKSYKYNTDGQLSLYLQTTKNLEKPFKQKLYIKKIIIKKKNKLLIAHLYICMYKYVAMHLSSCHFRQSFSPTPLLQPSFQTSDEIR